MSDDDGFLSADEINETERWESLAFEAGRVFRPTSPVEEKRLFSGRTKEVRRVIDVINQIGQHAIIFGERGVGKTSLASVLSQFFTVPTVVAPRINCESSDSFDSVWRKVFDRIQIEKQERPAGFVSRPEQISLPGDAFLPRNETLTTDMVRRALENVGQNTLPIIIIDEFDRLDKEAQREFADVIKTLSDHAVKATVVLVGVADSVDDLILEHASVERALVQIQMPRMSRSEIVEILQNALQRLEMTVEDDALERLCYMSRGLPHYAHLIGLSACRSAIDSKSMVIVDADVDRAIDSALKDAQQSIKTGWYRATTSPRQVNLFSEVLLACAVARTDEVGYFAPKDVRIPMTLLKGKKYEIPAFMQHLKEFCLPKRGPVLETIGQQRSKRFRFVNPLMQPFVIMKGLSTGLLTKEILEECRKSESS